MWGGHSCPPPLISTLVWLIRRSAKITTMSRPSSTRSLIRAFIRAGMYALLPCTLLFLRVPPTAAAHHLQADNKPVTPVSSATTANPILIELFTSEGCSSCPPADVFLQQLDETQPIPGAQLIVLSEHVTYWDHDGWKDPNSSPALTDRQAAYDTVLTGKNVYTPQMIVDGAQVKVDAQEITDALKKAAATPKIPVRIGAITVDTANPPILRARIETDVNAEKHAGDVYVAVALDHVESQVLRGENGGRHLIHVAVVQELTKIGKLQKGKSFAQDVQLKLKPGTDPRNVRLVALVQESGPGKVLGAAQRKPTI
jgi:hypothetical protein